MEKDRLDFSTIKKFTRQGGYCVSVELRDIKYSIDRYIEKYNLQMNPDFQRGHKWTENQQIKFMEYLLRGGQTDPIKFNHTEWMTDRMSEGEMVCVDGLQRTTAIIKFLDDELPVFGGYIFSKIDNLKLFEVSLELSVNNLKTRKEVLQWYVELNEGGTPHTEEEISKVKKMLEIESKPSLDMKKYHYILTDENIDVVYNDIVKALETTSEVVLNFEGVKSMTTTFAEKVFGRLYVELGNSKFFDIINLKNCDDNLKVLIRVGIHNVIN